MKISHRIAIVSLFLAVLAGCEKVWDTSGYDPLPNPSESPGTPGTGEGEPDPDPTDPPSGPQPDVSPDYQITGGVISRTVLNNYLSRAITQSEYLNHRGSNTDGIWGTADDRRMLLNVGAKFIGRALYTWGREDRFNSTIWLMNARNMVDTYHQYDPDAIFQAAVFEIVTKNVNQVPIPDWVFTAFGKEPETRNFNFDAIKSLNGDKVNHWGLDTCVPDMSREETQMWFYYVAVRYMEAGCEALHMGQVMMISNLSGGDSSQNYPGYRKVIGLIREAAKTKARRGIILLDGHMSNGGLIIDGKQYLDFISYPLRLREKTSEQATLGAAFDINGSYFMDNIIGRTGNMPYILEFDNFGISNHPGTAANDHYIWGYDEITWFAKLTYANSCAFLDYAVDYLKRVDPKGYIQMPGCRIVQLTDKVYRCNVSSADCPNGYGHETKIKEIWSR